MGSLLSHQLPASKHSMYDIDGAGDMTIGIIFPRLSLRKSKYCRHLPPRPSGTLHFAGSLV